MAKRRVAKVLVGLYLLALAASWVVRLQDSHAQSGTFEGFDGFAPTAAQRVVELPFPGRQGEKPVRLAIWQWQKATGETDSPQTEQPGNSTSPTDPGRRVDEHKAVGAAEISPPLVLIHGSPGDGAGFRRFSTWLTSDRDVLAPDLPGFGASSWRIPDYSSASHAALLSDWLEEAGIGRVHLAGYSLGGVVAAELAALDPQRVASVSLLSATGVQELELLGSYRLNHAVHGLQLASLWFLRQGTPHFGVLDRFGLSVEYARNFYDTDQRPLRGMLEALEVPVFIAQGRNDPLVPEAAAIEHARILPQSELLLLDTDHFYFFTGDAAEGQIAEALADFLRRVDAGVGVSRSEASTERLAAASSPFDPRSLPSLEGLALWVVGLLLALGTLVSEDLTTLGAGLLVGQGRLPFAAAAIACFLGIYIGDLMLYLAGRFLGRPLLRRAPFRWWLDEAAVETSSAWFRRRGVSVIFISRFLPGARLPTYFAAGALKTPFWTFAVYFFFAAALWTPALVALAATVGEAVLVRWQGRLGVVLIGALLLTALLRFLVLPLCTSRGRRRWLAAWRRWTRWEFWPPWLFYPPVVLYIFWLGFRFRGLTLFSASNPGIPAGGFVGESKQQILELYRPPASSGGVAKRARSENPEPPSSSAARAAPAAPTSPSGDWNSLPAWRLLPAGSTAKDVESFRQDYGLSYPIVLKPDAGQRGAGVAIVGDEGEAGIYLAASGIPVIAQAYIEGHELGVFYLRRPDEENGRIFAITDKRLPSVLGDGESTIEDLVYADERAMILADLYLKRFGADRYLVPAAGEVVALAALGTHCLGAIFLDGEELRTPALEAAVDRLGRSFQGFYFGRFDLRAPDLDSFRRGENLSILELNGVTSEATSIYDPSYGLLDAYRVLFEQWRWAFEIGAENRRRGAEVTSALALLRSALRYRGQARGQAPGA